MPEVNVCVTMAALAQSLWRGERWFMQIDSHMRFLPGWDTNLLKEISKCPSKLAIVTNYPETYHQGESTPAHKEPSQLSAWGFDSDGMLHIFSRKLQKCPVKPHRSLFWAAGFSFGPSSMISAVPYDELKNIFYGEEVFMAARLFTHGYDFFTPSQNYVFHLEAKKYRHSYRENFSKGDYQLESLSRVKIRQLLGMDTSGSRGVYGEFGLGNSRTLEEYETFCGVSFKDRTLSVKSRDGGLKQEDFTMSLEDIVDLGNC